ncbi:MAG TPA: hypothetical protein VHV57_17275 [Acidimicrobiales bacterium]|nr:hypothetical protein [Acidimicrobiales bacterium]
MKEEVFAVCAALALAESLLRTVGFVNDSAHLGRVFDEIEGRLSADQSPELSFEPSVCS